MRRLSLAPAVALAVALAVGAAMAAPAREPLVDRQVLIPVKLLDVSRVESVGLASLSFAIARAPGRVLVDLPRLGTGDRAFGAATMSRGEIEIVVVIVDPTPPARATMGFREQMLPLLTPRPTPESLAGITIRGLSSPIPRRAEIYGGYGFLGPHKAPAWCDEAPSSFLSSIPMTGLRRDPTLTAGAIDVLCNRTSARASRFRALFTPQVKPGDFSIGLTFDWNHGAGQSNVCSLLTTTPGQAGARATESITKPDGSTETKSFALDGKGAAATPFRINAYGTYTFEAKVTSGGVTRSATGQTNVTSAPGKGVGWCPAPP